MKTPLLTAIACFALTPSLVFSADEPNVLDIGSRRELFVDHYLIDKTKDVGMVLHQPRDEGPVLNFDKAWEGPFCIYSTVIKDGDLYRLYYRGKPTATKDGDENERTCYAESKDGIHWTRPELTLFTVDGHEKNNVVLADAAPLPHNFSPMLDTRPGVSADQRFKALAGSMWGGGLVAFASADGIRWKKMQEKPVIPKEIAAFDYMFDSQNVAFWSQAEERYLCYFRVFEKKIRRICRSESDDFIHWSTPVLMEYEKQGKSMPIEQLYTNQTHAYFRAPHIYVATAARFMPGRQVLSEAQAKAINVDPKYFKDTSDSIFMTTRGGSVYERTFMSGQIRPGIGARNWVSRTNYPALNVVQTGPTEMSIYTNADYAQPTAHLRRYSLRLDGFSSLRAAYEGGEMLTKPLIFSGKKLEINFSTSAAGGIKVEIQDQDGKVIPGFSLKEAAEQIGNEIDRVVSWKGGDDVSSLAGKPVRLRFVMKDADIFALKFSN
ncbi:MAG: hypothetical protein GXP30_10105 [Verrucomicrobia bacterium]|nr:hypothetical protein [Verrucomicrobiota bacterium]